MKREATGYWAFFCNPSKYDIEERLSMKVREDTWQISRGQEDMFKIGDKGLIRVGMDKRMGRSKHLYPGVYAFCEIVGLPHIRVSLDGLWIEMPSDYKDRYVVDIQITENLLHQPIHIDKLKAHPDFNDKIFLWNGYGWYSSYPLAKALFDIIFGLIKPYP